MEFYVTDACIGCGLCTTLDPETFTMTEAGVAEVFAQPAEAALALAATGTEETGPAGAPAGPAALGADAAGPLCAGGQSA